MNRGSLVLEATGLPTAPQPVSSQSFCALHNSSVLKQSFPILSLKHSLKLQMHNHISVLILSSSVTRFGPTYFEGVFGTVKMLSLLCQIHFGYWAICHCCKRPNIKQKIAIWSRCCCPTLVNSLYSFRCTTIQQFLSH